MAESTGISWCDATFNHVRGCTKVSPGCAHCYADTLSKRNPLTLGVWGPTGTRVVAAESAWREPVRWNRLAGEGRLPDGSPNPDGRRPRVFCASLADVFEDWQGDMTAANGEQVFQCDSCENPDGSMHWQACKPLDRDHHYECGCGEHSRPLTMQDVRARLFRLIDATPNLDWLLLTKRPENVLRMTPAGTTNQGGARPNVWLGTSCEDQAAADERIPHLLGTPAAVRFLSCEPLLGPVDLNKDETVQFCNACGETTKIDPNVNDGNCASCGDCRTRERGYLDTCLIDWVIVGGESGPGARPMHPDWARSLRDQCQAAGTAFFFKQWGEWVGGEDFYSGSDDECGPPGTYAGLQNATVEREAVAGPDRWKNWNDTGPDGNQVNDPVSVRVGKKAAGRLLDGRTWDEFPAARGG